MQKTQHLINDIDSLQLQHNQPSIQQKRRQLEQYNPDDLRIIRGNLRDDVFKLNQSGSKYFG